MDAGDIVRTKKYAQPLRLREFGWSFTRSLGGFHVAGFMVSPLGDESRRWFVPEADLIPYGAEI